jgi:glycerate 2-kinase
MHRENLFAIFDAAVAAVQPARLLPEHIQLSNNQLSICGRSIVLNKQQKIFVIGAGKASAAMAVEVEEILGDHLTAGAVITKYEHALPQKKIICYEAGHPMPDQQAVDATTCLLQLIQQATANDIIICLISGGASSLLIDLPGDIVLTEMQTVFQLLLRSGAAIDELNIVRKHLSGIKGGQLLRYAPAADWFSLIISDVPGNDLSVIASGPTSADNSSFSAALEILTRYKLWQQLPKTVQNYLQDGVDQKIPETLTASDLLLGRTHNKIIGSNRMAVDAAARAASEMGYCISGLYDNLTGDAAAAGRQIIKTALAYEGALPACFLWGGETTVTVTGTGKGGRNQHLALSACQALTELQGQQKNISVLAAGTDGTDGPTDAAGAIVDNLLLQQIKNASVDIPYFLQQHDAYRFFQQYNGLLITGATQTNVMDLVIVLVDRPDFLPYLE